MLNGFSVFRIDLLVFYHGNSLENFDDMISELLEFFFGLEKGIHVGQNEIIDDFIIINCIVKMKVFFDVFLFLFFRVFFLYFLFYCLQELLKAFFNVGILWFDL